MRSYRPTEVKSVSYMFHTKSSLFHVKEVRNVGYYFLCFLFLQNNFVLKELIAHHNEFGEAGGHVIAKALGMLC